MASTSSSSLPHRSANYRPPTSNAPQGTFLPGTKVQVGSHRVVIEKYLSEGGFAHVYVVRVPREDNKHELAVLKRVAVPDKDHLGSMRTEVETMKKLKGHKHVVTYMDSHASPLKGGGYEVFLLMEYCSGGGLIDFMNTRLQHRLTEPEILKIFGDIAEGVACMHYLKPPLLHRDLKVENVLISKTASDGTPMYKLCDFGSTAAPRPAAKTAEEGRLIEDDVQQHTTMQYRSPEMIDVWRKQPIDEKADIWALGVFLYKLCYYTTPFEDVGQMAILNASFKYPSQPRFSDQIKKFIGWMLKEDPKQRPNIYQVIKEVCSMRGTAVPIKDIYANRTQSETRRNESLPDAEPAVGLQKQAPQVQVHEIPEIAPMRRGRPTAPTQQAPVAAKPSPSPVQGDPFAALDSKNYNVRSGAVDELSKRFPSLDEFSIVHEKSGAFSFNSRPSSKATATPSSGLNQRVTNALADEVFKQPRSKEEPPQHQQSPQISQQLKSSPSKSSNVASKAPEMSKQTPVIVQPTPVRPGASYIDTGVGTSPPPPAIKSKIPEISNRPIWKVPDQTRSSSQPRASDSAQAAAALLQPSLPPSQRAAMVDLHRSKSQTAQSTAKSPSSSERAPDGHKPTQLDVGDGSITRAKSVQSRQRPSSAYVASNLEFLRDQETSRKRPSMEEKRHSRQPSQDARVSGDGARFDEDLDYLRNAESNDLPQRKSSRSRSSGHKKRTSLVNAKNMVTGRFGDAFKRFDRRSSQDMKTDPVQLTPEPDDDDGDSPTLSPILGSEPTMTGRGPEPGSAIDESEDLPADMRRELERQTLAQEEKRVADAAADYRARTTEHVAEGNLGSTRASTIQKRVQSLLDEGRQPPIPYKRTAEGYGRYTDNAEVQGQASQDAPTQAPKAAPPPIAKKPIATAELPSGYLTKVKMEPVGSSAPVSAPALHQSSQIQPRIVTRPSVPPKSQALRTGGSSRSQWPPASPNVASNVDKPLPPKPSGGLAALLAKDLEGVPDYPPRGSSMTEPIKPNRTVPAGVANRQPAPEDFPPDQSTAAAPFPAAFHVDDLEADFSKRYPSLSGIEMVETEIGHQGQRLRMKEV